MKMKQIAMSFGMLAFVGAVVVGGTGAFFSDTETSTGNVFTAGSVSIEFDGINHVYGYGNGDDPVDGYFETSTANNIPFFSFNDMKPRDAGTLTFGLGNGANEAYVCGFIGGDAPTENPDLALWENLNFYDADDNQVTPGNWIDLGTIDANQSDDFSVKYCFGDWDGTSCDVDPGVDYNDAQLGSFGATLKLFAIQTRNNPNFDCATLNEDGFEIQTAEDWPTTAGLLESEEWKAEGRYGDGGGPQTWEIGVGTDTQGTLQANGNYSWLNGSSVQFTVDYDSSNGEATFTVGGSSQTYEVNSTADKLAFVARGTDGVGFVTLTDMELDGSAVASELEATDGPKSIVISGLDLSQDFTASGNVEFEWNGSPNGSDLAFQVVAGN